MSAEQKLDRFRQSIFDELHRQEADLHSRMEEERKAAFAKAEDEVLAQCYTYIKGETARLQAKTGRSVSERTMELRREVIQRRSHLADQLFEELENRIREFLVSESYPLFLQRKFSEIQNFVPNEKHMEICISPEDAEKLTLENIKVIEKRYSLGGFEVFARDEKKFFDVRLDSRIQQLRRDFITMFDITI